MAAAACGAWRTLIVVATIAALVTPPVSAQAPVDVYELADYRLTKDVFDRFVQANASIVNIIEEDASFNDAPLFTKDIALSGDAVAEAAGLMARLANHAALAAALEPFAINNDQTDSIARRTGPRHLRRQAIDRVEGFLR